MKITKTSKKSYNIKEQKTLEESSVDRLPDLSDANISALFNSNEFKTPISDEETERYLAASVKESTLNDVQEVDEETLTECIKKYLTEAYTTVADFKLSKCRLVNKKFFVEGKISFINGKSKNTIFEFVSYGKNILKGKNTGINESVQFQLAFNIEANGKLLTEGLKYSYTYKNKLVEGLSRASKGV